MHEKVIEIVRLLLDRTRKGKAKWSYIPEDTTIRTQIDNAIVRIAKDAISFSMAAGETESTNYFAYILDPSGRVKGEAFIPPGDKDFADVDELFQLVRKDSPTSDKMLDDLIQTLKG